MMPPLASWYGGVGEIQKPKSRCMEIPLIHQVDGSIVLSFRSQGKMVFQIVQGKRRIYLP